MDDLLGEFLAETDESLATLDNELVELEKNPNDKELLGNIFRLVHTIKGTCGFLGLPRLESVAHAGENVLGKFRDGELVVDANGVSGILECFDRIKELLESLAETGSESEGDDSELIAKLNGIAQIGGAEASSSDPAEIADLPKPPEGQMGDSDELQAIFEATPGPEDAPADEPAPEVQEAQAPPSPEPAAKAEAPAEKKEPPHAVVQQQTLRVNMEVLEELMNMVSELVLTRNQLMQILRNQKDSEFTLPLQRLSLVTSELQEGVMKTRMQPIGNAWSKLPRIIRDLSIELNKKIELQMNGQETELDRQVLDLIKDPLTHMVRNSADHGIEVPAERLAAGKSETGTVVLNAYHEGGHIIIEINDDGKGLNFDRIKEKAIENGIHTAAELEEMGDGQVAMLIFHPGFSTAAEVTAVSGRGVGMDVVRTNIEKIGGHVELVSKPGKGTRFTIKIPLTLAIVSALIVESSGEKFAVPQLSVVELVRVSKDSEHTIEDIRGTPVLRLRERLLPLVMLDNLLNLEPLPKSGALGAASPSVTQAPTSAEAAETQLSEDVDAPPVIEGEEATLPEAAEKAPAPEQALVSEEPAAQPPAPVSKGPVNNLYEQYIIVSKVGTYSYGIVVDDVFDTEEIVVKPVAPILRDISIFSGNTILGDGSVIMILDPNGIAAASGEITTSDEDSEETSEKDTLASNNKVSLLLFGAGDGGPKAVPLSLVARLEDIAVESIEYSDGRPMVQYRDKLMPLVKFDESQTIPAEGNIPLIVFTDNDQSMGLVIDSIVDIVEDEVKSDITGSSDNLVGSTVISEKATDIINVSYYLDKAFGNWFKHKNADQGGEASTTVSKRLLLVDDSMFFRNLIVPMLTISGFDVVAVESGQDVMNLCDKGEDFDVIVSDIEMPDMTGLELVQKIRETSSWKDKPVLALTSLANPEDVQKGIAAGFNAYLSKTDRDQLIESIKNVLVEIDSKTNTASQDLPEGDPENTPEQKEA